jgi:hypothetical protein
VERLLGGRRLITNRFESHPMRSMDVVRRLARELAGVIAQQTRQSATMNGELRAMVERSEPLEAVAPDPGAHAHHARASSPTGDGSPERS